MIMPTHSELVGQNAAVFAGKAMEITSPMLCPFKSHLQ
jgi:hypothetical protein